jgi:hypothetical protein
LWSHPRDAPAPPLVSVRDEPLALNAIRSYPVEPGGGVVAGV